MLKYGWMLQPTTSTTSQRASVNPSPCQILRGSVVVHDPVYPAALKLDLVEEMKLASSEAVQ